jgi:hypothetical protein
MTDCHVLPAGLLVPAAQQTGRELDIISDEAR